MGERKKGLPQQTVNVPRPELVMFLTSIQGGVAQHPASPREQLLALGLASGDLSVNVLIQQATIPLVKKVIEDAENALMIAKAGLVMPTNGDGPVDLAKIAADAADAQKKLRGEE